MTVIIELAEEVGREKFGEKFGYFFRYLEMSYLLSTLRRPFFDDVEIRLKQNLLLYWQRGYFKSSSMIQFLKEMTPSENMVSNPNAPHTYLNIVEVTKQRLRGSAVGKKLIPPIINRPNIIVIPELMHFLGSGEGMKDNVNFMLTMLEESMATVGLVKMAHVDPDPEMLREMQQYGVTWNPVTRMLTFSVPGSFWVASRPLDHYETTFLENSGFFDRFLVLTQDVRALSDAWSAIQRGVDVDASELRTYNELVANIKFNRIEYPPSQFIKVAMREMDKIYRNIEKSGMYSSVDVRSARDTVLMAQVMAAYAIDRTIETRGIRGEYSGILYDTEVLRRSIMCIEDIILRRALIRNLTPRSVLDAEFESDAEVYRTVRVNFGDRADYKTVVKKVVEVLGCSERTARGKVKMWQRNKWIEIRPNPRDHRRGVVVFLVDV